MAVRPKYIFIHYSATLRGNAKIFDIHHREVNGWSHLGYHYVLPTDGSIENMIGEYTNGIHAPGYNSNSIAICLVCNDETPPNRLQVRNALIICHSLMSRLGIGVENILGHREGMERAGKPDHTVCPGMFIDMDLFRQAIRLSRANYKELMLRFDALGIY